VGVVEGVGGGALAPSGSRAATATAMACACASRSPPPSRPLQKDLRVGAWLAEGSGGSGGGCGMVEVDDGTGKLVVTSAGMLRRTRQLHSQTVPPSN